MADHLYCKHRTLTGQRCRARADEDTGYCWWHDPATEERRTTGILPERSTTREPGGTPVLPEPAVLETAEEVAAFLQHVANHVATAAKPDVARAHALNTTAGVLLRALEARKLERRLEAVREELRRMEEQYTQALAQRQEADRERAEMREHAQFYRERMLRAGIDPETGSPLHDELI